MAAFDPTVRTRAIDWDVLVRMADPRFDERRDVVYEFGADVNKLEPLEGPYRQTEPEE